MNLLDFEWQEVLTYLLKLLGAFLLAAPIGFERERSTQAMGLRTFPLVAVASCGFLLMAHAVIGDDAEANARIIAGLMTGMGFIGGGAILKHGKTVRGTATAASLWTTGVLGGAVAYGLYEIAVLISIINFLTFKLLTPLEERYFQKKEKSEEEE